MAELLILEFEGFAEADYDAVNSDLGVDMVSGEGDWPAGLHTHTRVPMPGTGSSSRSGRPRTTRRTS